MNGFDSDEATRAALEAFRARHAPDEETPGLRGGQPARVRRLDRPGAYLLVPILDSSGSRGMVQLAEDGRTVESSAIIRDPTSRLLLHPAAAAAMARAALPAERGWGDPYLGWRPCRESFDSLRPLWVVPHAAGEAFVTQAGTVFETLTSGKGG